MKPFEKRFECIFPFIKTITSTVSNITLLLPFALIMLFSIQVYSSYGDVEKISYKIDSLVSVQINEDAPGGVIAVLEGEKLLHKNAYGLMDIEQKIMNHENTLFDMASVAKQFTAFAILLLEEQGKINLDDDVRTYLPELPAYEHSITVRHLLQHTSGIASTDWLRLISNMPFDEEWTQQDEIDIIFKYEQLNFKPNTSYVYSNGGYSLLANIVESVSNMHFAEFLEKNIFMPLQMNASFVNYKAIDNAPDMAKGYSNINGSYAHVSSINDYSYGAGNIFSSLNDMIKWGQNFLEPGIGSPETIHRIFNKYNALENGDTINYTYGFNVRNHRGLKLVEHSGGLPGFRNQFMIFPEHDLVVIIMFNNESVNTRSLAFNIAETVLFDKMKPEEATLPRVEIALEPGKAKRFEGNYRMADGMEMGFAIQDNEFWLILPGDDKFRLYPESESSFFLKDFEASLTFIVNDKDEVDEMIWHQSGKDYPANRVEFVQALSSDAKAKFAGKYTQVYLGEDYSVLFENDTLQMLFPHTFEKYFGFGKLQLNHISGDKFSTERLGIVEFTRNDKLDVCGFGFPEMGRLNNVRFVKLKQ
jgi:CubicO group peptidase (beta-lactamase class C family)